MNEDTTDDDPFRRRKLLKAATAASVASMLAGCRTGFDESETTTGETTTTEDSDGTTAESTATERETETTTTVVDGNVGGVDPCSASRDPELGPECSEPGRLDSDVVVDTTLGEECNEYVVTESIAVHSGGTLTVRPGTVVRFEEGAGLAVRSDGSLVAEGSCQDPVVFTGTASQRGHWGGIAFDGAGGNRLSYCVVEYAGAEFEAVAPDRAGVVAGAGATLSIEHSSIRNNSGFGIGFGDDVTITNLTDNVVTENTLGAAVATHRSARALAPANDFTGNDVNLVHVAPGGSIPGGTSHTWSALEVPYRVAGDVTVQGELTIRPGNTVSFAEGSSLQVDGELFAIGSAEDRIDFTATDQQRGHWSGIGISGRGSLAHCTVEYAGGRPLAGTGHRANVGIGSGARATLENCTLRRSDGYGLAVGQAAEISGFTGNSLTGNRDGGAAVPSSVVHLLGDSNEFSGNGESVVEVAVTGPIRGGERRTWPAIDARYRIEDSLTVQGTLVLEPGTTLAFGGRSALRVEGGRLRAEGTADDRITFTGANKQPGNWQGILLNGDPAESSTLRRCLVEFGGGSGLPGADRPANVSVVGGTVSIDGCRIRGSDSYGVTVREDATIESFENNAIRANGSGAAYVRLSAARDLSASTTYSGNDQDFVDVVVGDGIPAGEVHAWSGLDVPYRVEEDLVVRGRLELSPGTTVAMGRNAGIEVRSSGAMNAVGAADRRIRITGMNDQSGFWRGIHLSDSADRANEFRYCQIRYGGSERFVPGRVPANLTVTGNSYVTVRNCTFEFSAGVGLHATLGTTLDTGDNEYRFNEEGATDIVT